MSTTQPLKKSEFIRTLPFEMPANEVIERAKEAGYEVSYDLVRKARSRGPMRGAKKNQPVASGATVSASKSGASAAAAPAKPQKKSKAKGKAAPKAGGSKPKRGAKAAFVREQPKTMSVAEIVEKAKKAGLQLTEKYAAEILLLEKKDGKPARRAKGGKKRAAAKASKPRQAAKRALKSKAAAVVQKAVKHVVKASSVAAPASARKAPAKGAAPRGLSPEMTFVQLALSLGLQKAQDLLAAVDARLAGLVASI
jgi:hypothetical protein